MRRTPPKKLKLLLEAGANPNIVLEDEQNEEGQRMYTKGSLLTGLAIGYSRHLRFFSDSNPEYAQADVEKMRLLIKHDADKSFVSVSVLGDRRYEGTALELAQREAKPPQDVLNLLTPDIEIPREMFEET